MITDYIDNMVMHLHKYQLDNDLDDKQILSLFKEDKLPEQLVK
jgi:hypothetical protein